MTSTAPGLKKMKRIGRDDPILIVGAGAWGCSISLALARRGYENITVLDGHEFPSAIAAGNDINKIMEEGQKVSASQATALVQHRRCAAGCRWLLSIFPVSNNRNRVSI